MAPPQNIASHWLNLLPSLCPAFVSRPAFTISKTKIQYPSKSAILKAWSSSDFNIDHEDNKRRDVVFIEKIELDDIRQLQLMSEFCIDMFFNSQHIKQESFISRGWRNLKLAAMQKSQMLDLTMPTGGNRAIFVAKNSSSEIIGCCEVIEEKLDLSYPDYNATTKQQGRKKIARLRPIIENLSVHPKHRRKGIGLDLVSACENAVQEWIPKYGEIYAQVDEDNTSSLNLFNRCGYSSLFVDSTATKLDLDGSLFAKGTTVSKVMMRKFLCDDSDLQFF